MIKTLEQINQEFVRESMPGIPASPMTCKDSGIYPKGEIALPMRNNLRTDVLPAQHGSVFPGPAKPSVSFQHDALKAEQLPVSKNVKSAGSIHEWAKKKTGAAWTPADQARTSSLHKAPVFAKETTQGYAPPSEKGKTKTELTGMPEKAKKSGIKRLLDVCYYIVMVSILLVTLIFSRQTSGVHKLFGYSGFTVLTSSMQSRLPRGALVITRETASSDIRIGDDITFIRDDHVIITHQVMDIIENYNGSGRRGFQTQGTENRNPDADIVQSERIIGVVKLYVPELGFILNYIAAHIGLVVLLFGSVTVTGVAIHRFLNVWKVGDGKKKKKLHKEDDHHRYGSIGKKLSFPTHSGSPLLVAEYDDGK